MFALYCLTRHLQKFGIKVSLFMPYIPNARMDRVKVDEDTFTLKYFAEIINSLSFTSVSVLDPHSSVSEALIERIRIFRPDKYIRRGMSAWRPCSAGNTEDAPTFRPRLRLSR